MKIIAISDNKSVKPKNIIDELHLHEKYIDVVHDEKWNKWLFYSIEEVILNVFLTKKRRENQKTCRSLYFFPMARLKLVL